MADEREQLSEAIAAAKAGEHAHALAALQVVVQEFPRSIEGWLWLGLVVEDAADAEECFQRVLTLDPKHAQAREYLAALKEGRAPELPKAAPVAPPPPPSELDRFRQSLGVSAPPVSQPPATPAPGLARQSPPSASSKPTPPRSPGAPQKSAAATPPSKRRKRGLRLSTGKAVAIGLLGIWAMALCCGAPAAFVIWQLGNVGSTVAQSPAPTQTAFTPDSVASEPTATPTALPSGVDIAAPTTAPDDVVIPPAVGPTVIEPALAAGRILVQQGRYLEARAALLPVVAVAPGQAEAYALLAHADVGALIATYEAEPVGLTVEAALEDAAVAVALDPTQGDRYLLRALAATEALRRVDDPQAREDLAAAARADLDTANRLGVSGSAFNAWLPLAQARVGLCEDGYRTATQALAAGGRLEADRAWLQYGASLNAHCRERFDEAGAYARQAAETLDGAFPQARELEILSLQARKRLSEALTKAEALLAEQPDSGPRLALLSFLRYESGDRLGAEADLQSAATLGATLPPWERYTRGRLTVDTGNTNGWEAVREGSVRLDPALGWLRAQWGDVLTQAGESPAASAALVDTPALDHPAVATYGASPPNPGLLTPLEAGRSWLLVGQLGSVLHFQPMAPIGVAEVTEIRIAALGLQSGADPKKIEVALWDQKAQRWVAHVLDGEGVALVKQPARFVSVEGDLYVSARTLVAERWSLSRLTVTYAGVLEDGTTFQIGPDPSAPGDVASLTAAEQATALVAVGRLDDAREVLLGAIEAVQERTERGALLDQLAQVVLLRGDPNEAAEHMIAALAVETLPERHFVLGLALDLTGDVSGARREYELALAPGNPLLPVSRGLAEGRIQQLTR